VGSDPGRRAVRVPPAACGALLTRAAAFVFAAAVLRVTPVAAQAFTPPAGVGSVTLEWQFVSNTGHRLSDGYLIEGGQSLTMGGFLEAEWGLTDRLAASAAIAYVFAKYTDPEPPPSFFPFLPVDECHCWNSSFQDITLAARYRFGDDPWAVSPVVRVVLPSHDYNTQGEAVVGRNLREFQVGAGGALRLAWFLPRATLQAGYTYSFVEEVYGIPNDRSNGYFELGYLATNRLYLRVEGRWQKTHGGLRFGSVTGDPFFPPGEVDTPELIAEHDRLLKDNYWRVGGGLSYSLGDFDVFVAFSEYVAGTDTHAGHAWAVGLTYYFGGIFRP
jgi:hypothetical protein